MDKPASKKKGKVEGRVETVTTEPDKKAKKPKEAKDFRIFNEEIAAIVEGVHANPFSVLGIHEFGKEFVARTFIPGAEEVVACTLAGEEVGNLPRRHDAGFFEGAVSVKKRQPLKYKARN